MAPDGCIQIEHGFMTEYRIAWYHHQSVIPSTHRGHPTYTIKIGTPLPDEKPRIYGLGCTHRAEVHCGNLDLLIACNYNHDDDVLCNPQIMTSNTGSETVTLDTRPGIYPDGNLQFKLHKAKDKYGHRFVDLYMHLLDSKLGQQSNVLIFGKKVENEEREGLTPADCFKLGIPREVWEDTKEAQP